MFSIRCTNLRGLPSCFCSISSRATHNSRNFSTTNFSAGQAGQIKKVSETAENENKMNFFRKPKLKKQATNLIFGDRLYKHFTEKEKRLVDSYQEYAQLDSNLILPNTALAEDCKKVDKLYSHLFTDVSHLKKTD